MKRAIGIIMFILLSKLVLASSMPKLIQLSPEFKKSVLKIDFIFFLG